MSGLTAKSLTILSTCSEPLQRLVKAVAKKIDTVVITGHREKDAQDEAYASGKSKLPWPRSKHNSTPSQAVDMAPAPLDWNDIVSFRDFAEIVKDTAAELGIEVTWGGDWKMRDYVHWELS